MSPPADAPVPPTPAPAAVGRRRVLAGGAALGIALLGTGLLRPSTGAPASTTARTDAGTDGRRRDLRVGLRDERRPSDDPPAGAGAGDEGPAAWSFRSPSAPAAGPPADAGTAGPTGAGAAAVGTDDGTVRVTTPDLSLAGLEPGDAGVVTADLDLAGGPATLRLATTVTGSEAGLTEPERVAGDDATAGELAAALGVVLTVEPAGGLARTLYEGSLAGLGALPDGVRLAACAAPGRHRVRLSWLVPTDATNAIASDVATVALGFLATDCGAPAPTEA